MTLRNQGSLHDPAADALHADFDPSQIAEEGVFRLPYSLTTRLAPFDLSDVAEVAARVVTENGHTQPTYSLCGTDLLSGQEVADLISRATDVPVAAEEIPLAGFVDMISRHQPLPCHTIGSLYRLFTYCGLHGITGNANVLRWLLGPRAARDGAVRRPQPRVFLNTDERADG